MNPEAFESSVPVTSARIEVTTIDGKVWVSDTDEVTESVLHDVREHFRSIKTMDFLSITINKNEVYFNPDHVISIHIVTNFN